MINNKNDSLEEFEEQGKDLNFLLRKASSYGDIEYIKKYLNMGVNINDDSNNYQLNPLYLALSDDKFEAVEFLINNGASLINYPNVFNEFIEVDYESYMMQYYSGYTDLKFTMPRCQILARNGLNVNNLNHYGETPLHDAVFFCLGYEKNAIKCLLDMGVNINIKNSWGKTILDEAIKYKPELVNFLKDLKAKKSDEIGL